MSVSAFSFRTCFTTEERLTYYYLIEMADENSSSAPAGNSSDTTVNRRQNALKEFHAKSRHTTAVLAKELDAERREKAAVPGTAMDKVLDKLKPLAQAVVTGFILNRADVFRVMRSSMKINHTFLYVSYAFFLVTTVVGIYLTYFVSGYRSIETWQTGDSHQRLIEIATLSVVVGSICWNIALWPVFHIWTLPLGICFMFFVVSLVVLLPNAPKKKKMHSL